jgi:hypothetical protein
LEKENKTKTEKRKKTIEKEIRKEKIRYRSIGDVDLYPWLSDY